MRGTLSMLFQNSVIVGGIILKTKCMMQFIVHIFDFTALRVSSSRKNLFSFSGVMTSFFGVSFQGISECAISTNFPYS